MRVILNSILIIHMNKLALLLLVQLAKELPFPSSSEDWYSPRMQCTHTMQSYARDDEHDGDVSVSVWDEEVRDLGRGKHSLSLCRGLNLIDSTELWVMKETKSRMSTNDVFVIIT